MAPIVVQQNEPIVGRPLRVAIAGAGMIANSGHVPAWRALGDQAEIVAVYSRTLAKAEKMAQRAGIPLAFDDYKGMLRQVRPDVVVICTPNASHSKLAHLAFAENAHVLCEKPIATNYRDAIAMYNAADWASRTLMVGQSGRFTAETLAAKAIVDQGRLGEIYYAECAAMRRRGVPQWGRFHIKADSGGGAVLDIGVHALDALLWMMGNPQVVRASGAMFTKLANRDEGLVTSLADSGAPEGVFDPRPYCLQEFDVEDMGVGLLRLENGAAISIKASWAANVPPGQGGTMMLGTEGGLRLNPLTLISRLGNYQADITPIVPPDPKVPFYGIWREVAHFARVLRGEEQLIVTRDVVLNVIRALEGLYVSSELGHEVSLEGSWNERPS